MSPPDSNIIEATMKEKPVASENEAQIAIRPEYLNLLKHFGDPLELTNYAVEAYIVNRILKYIEECKAEIKKYEAKYGSTYQEFFDKLLDVEDKDPTFVRELEKQHPTYEDDFITWGAFTRELEKWNAELKSILMS